MIFAITALLLLGLTPGLAHAADSAFSVAAPPLVIKGVEFEITVVTGPASGVGAVCEVTLDGSRAAAVPCPAGETVIGPLVAERAGRPELAVAVAGRREAVALRSIHGLWTVLPPVLAIGLALAFRQVVAALWVSVWLGAFIIYDWRPLTAVARSVDHYIIGAMSDPDDAAMLVFIIFMGGMIGMIAKSGGIQGIVELVARRATSPARAQVATFFMGLFIFFDDYANTIIVGSSMRPITDRLRVSREKLSYLVDSTAAPVASIFPISTWIGYEVGLIDRALESIGGGQSGYMLFLESIAYRFYPIFALALVLIVALSGRDFGPMARAEIRSRRTGKTLRDGALPMTSLDQKRMSPPEGKPHRWYNAMVPLLAVIAITFMGLWINGLGNLGEEAYLEIVKASTAYGAAWSKVFIVGQVYSEASPNIVLAWASLAGCIITVAMVTVQRVLTMGDAMSAWLSGVESMVIAIVVLLFAWSLGQVCKDLHTADYLTTSLAGVLSPRVLPALVFLLACAISFATGTSYGTMGILMPLVIPIADRLAANAGLDLAHTHLTILGVVSSVLSGAVFGDHCSPISDTTIMSSMSTASDHVDHVRTQLPYALLAGAVGLTLGDIPTAHGLHPAVSIVLGITVMALFLRFFGKRVDTASQKKLKS